ncbi:MAG: lipid-A-disaccharide synthase [Candidatus Marinimicrobia bacterium]|nr:lipid-A-disaccharide synthase [Candidatus Neomarinimicrobiota bacterium]
MIKKINLKSICIIAGDHSADEPGVNIVKNFKYLYPDINIFGIGGDKMQSQGMKLLYHSNETTFMGFFEILKHLSFVRRMFKNVISAIKKTKPDAIILIDYPGFNLRLAKKLKRVNIPIFYYIAPQTWAWKEGRVKQIYKYIDHLFAIYPFEKKYFAQYKIPVTYVGNPLAQTIIDKSFTFDPLKQLDLKKDLPIISFLPGSREQEIKNHLPVIYDTIKVLHKKFPHWQFVISKSKNISQKIWDKYNIRSNYTVYQGNINNLLAHSSAIAVASGTASLQAALHKKPMVIFYKTSFITYFIARIVTKIRFIGMINILGGNQLVPELIQGKFNVDKLSTEIQKEVLIFNHQAIKQAKIERTVNNLLIENSTETMIGIMLELIYKKKNK